MQARGGTLLHCEALSVIRCLPMTRLFIICLIGAATCSAAVFNVKDFGAKGDGKTQERDSINKAIEAAAGAGGGTVQFPPGVYVSGSIRLRSNVTLDLERGSTI